MVNEIQNGLAVQPVPKPEALVEYEKVEALNMPLWGTCIWDQPHIWLMEVSVIRNVRAIFAAIAEANARSRVNGHQEQEHDGQV